MIHRYTNHGAIGGRRRHSRRVYALDLAIHLTGLQCRYSDNTHKNGADRHKAGDQPRADTQVETCHHLHSICALRNGFLNGKILDH